MFNGRPDNARKIKQYAYTNTYKYNIINTWNGRLAELRCVQYFIFYIRANEKYAFLIVNHIIPANVLLEVFIISPL